MIVRDLLIKLGFSTDTRQLSGTEKQIDRLKASTIALGGVMANLAQQGLGKVANEMRASAESSIEFGRGIANLSSIMGGTEADTRKMAQAAKDLGKEFGVMPEQISAAMYDVVGSLGYTSDTIAQTREAVKLGKAGAATTSEAFQVLMRTTLAYGDTSEAAMRKVSDLASATIRLGVLTMPELSASISSVTPLASSLGVSLEELFAVQAALSGPSGTASEVYTQMSSAMTALLRQNKTMEGQFEKTFKAKGINTVAEAIGKFGLQGTLKQLVDDVGGSQEALTEMFGRIEAVRFALAATGSQAGRYTRMQRELTQVTGEVDRAVAKQTTGMGAAAFALDKTRAAAQAERIEIGEKLAPAMIGLEAAGAKVFAMFAENILPAFTAGSGAIIQMSDATTVLGGALNIVGRVLGAVRIAIESVLLLAQEVYAVITGLLAASIQLVKLNPKGAAAVLSQMPKQISENYANYKQSVSGTAEFVSTGHDPSKTSAARAAASAAAMERITGLFGAAQTALSGALQTPMVRADVGGVTVNVTVPAGTTGQGAALIADQGSRSMLAQFMAGVQQSFPVQQPGG